MAHHSRAKRPLHHSFVVQGMKDKLTFSPVYRAAKAIYYGVFNKIATASLGRTRKKNLSSGELNKPSIKIVSYFGWQNGISEGAALQSAALRMLGYKVDAVDITRAMTNPFAHIACQEADLFIIHCGGNQFLRAAWPLRQLLLRGKVVGYFAWELPDPPRDWPGGRLLWDEIWTPSHYSARSLSQWCDYCPIRVVPHVFLHEGTGPREWRKGKERLRFLTMADARSSLSRKNPQGAIEAFRLAFPGQSDVELVVKLHKTDVRNSPELDRLIAAIKADSRVRLINRTMNRDEMNQLMLNAHAFVSLHRSEGFGIPLLEAQTLGLATIATAWSGNMDFTTADTTILIPYTIKSTHDTGGVYGDVTWAEPDVEAAAAAMRKLYYFPGELARIAAAGWEASRPQQQLSRLARALPKTRLCPNA
jgi:glycosyltransferase involved in cell wall biosynthesis